MREEGISSFGEGGRGKLVTSETENKASGKTHSEPFKG